MLDAYSYRSGPTKEQAVSELKSYFNSINGQSHLTIHGINTRCIDIDVSINNVIYGNHRDKDTFGSLTGWTMFFKRDLINEITDHIINISNSSKNFEP